jgi:hypothetical protein
MLVFRSSQLIYMLTGVATNGCRVRHCLNPTFGGFARISEAGEEEAFTGRDQVHNFLV